MSETQHSFNKITILTLGCANCNVVKNPTNDDPCKGKEDGIYGTGDSFGYMICKNQHASYVSCGNELFDACTKRCVNPEQVGHNISSNSLLSKFCDPLVIL